MKNIPFFLNARILLFALVSLVFFSYSYSNFSTLVYGQSTVVNNTAIYVNSSSINDNSSITSSNKILVPAGNLTIGSMPSLTNLATTSQDKNAILESNNSLNSNDINHTSLMSSNPITNYSGSSNNYLPSSSSSTSSLSTTNSTQNITGGQEGDGQEIDTGDEEEHILTVPEAQAIKSNLVIPDSSPFKSNQCTPVDSLEKFVPNPFMKDLNTTRFIVGNCITVSGKVTWTHYMNSDGDANFNIKLDKKYNSLLTPANNNKKLKGTLHVEVVCQGKNSSTDPVKMNQCKIPKYDGPNFEKVLPKVGKRVQVTGIYVIDIREGGHAELHPAYLIKRIS